MNLSAKQVALSQQAAALVRSGKLEVAAAIYKNLLESLPDSPVFGYALRDMGRLDEALERKHPEPLQPPPLNPATLPPPKQPEIVMTETPDTTDKAEPPVADWLAQLLGRLS